MSGTTIPTAVLSQICLGLISNLPPTLPRQVPRFDLVSSTFENVCRSNSEMFWLQQSLLLLVLVSRTLLCYIH